MVFKGETEFRKRAFRLTMGLVLLIVVLSVFDFAAATLHASRRTATADIKYYYNITSQDKVVALTFDDGPDPEKTPEIMDILERNDATATFFFLGSHALKHPALVKEAYERGFEIGNHTYTHSKRVHESPKRIALELHTTNRIIESITGEPTVLYRPPYLLDIGSDPTYDPNTIDERLEWIARTGYIAVGADIDSRDWAVETGQELIDNVLRGLDERQGHIVLLHDGGEGRFTTDVLEELIVELKNRGYRFATAGEVLGVDAIEQMRVTKDLAPGMTDVQAAGQVSGLQLFLIKEGYLERQADGFFDDETEAALRRWQKDRGIVREAGHVGDTTRSEIARSLDPLRVVIDPPQGASIPLIQGRMEEWSILLTSFASRAFDMLAFGLLCFMVLRLSFILELYLIKRMSSPPVLPPWRSGVSVVIPVYNEAENVRATLMSVIRSRHRPLEIIVVDDGSTDASAAVIESVRREHPGLVRLVRVRNGGKARALNLGMSIATYDVVVTMDGDTIFDPRAIGMLARHFNDPRVGSVAGKVSVTKARNILNYFQHIEYVIAQNIDKTGLTLVNSIGVVPGPIGAWRTSDVIAAGGYSTDTLVEDQDLTLALLRMGRRIVYEPGALAFTETPYTIRDFVKQRFRWVFGTLQCAWKYKGHFWSMKRPALGFVVLPSVAASLVLSLLYPVMDVLLVSALVLGYWPQAVGLYLIFTIVDLLYASMAFEQEKGSRRALVLLPLQRVFYRFVIYYVVLRSFVKAIEGSEALWSKVKKRGDTGLHPDLIGAAPQAVSPSSPLAS